MTVLLTHAYFLYDDPKEQQIMRPYPPLGILYLSAYLSQHQVENTVFDTTFSTKKNLQNYLLEHHPPIIALYTNLMTKIKVIECIQFIKQQKELQQSTIILGGPDVTYNVDNYLHQGADFLVIGEGEQTLLALVQTLQTIDRPNFHHIKGIAFKDKSGKIVQTTGREKIKDINTLPFPNRAAINLHQYLEVWKKKHGLSAISVSTQRGCPYTCKWCSTAVYGQSYRRRSPEKVVEELLYLKKEYNPDTIWFVDDVFTVSHKWLKAFKNEVIQRDAIIPFECITRADRMNEQVVQLLKEAGAFRVWIGAESGSQRIIDAMDRRVKVEQVQKMIQLTRAQGIQAGTFIMLGYPKETKEDIAQTLAHLKASNPDQFTITVAYPIKGTSLYHEIEAVQTTFPDWAKSTDRDIDFKRTYSRQYYNYAMSWITNEVQYHKQYLANQHWYWSGIRFKLKAVLAKMSMWRVRRLDAINRNRKRIKGIV